MPVQEANRNKVLLLVALAGAWACLLGWQLFNSDEPVRVALKNATGMVVKPRSLATSGELHVNLERLQASSGQRETTFTQPRNIFSSLVVHGEPNGRPDAQAAPPEQALPSPAEERKLAAAAQLNQYRYLGFLRFRGHRSPDGRDLAVLMKEDEVHLVHAGDTIEKQVLVRSIQSDGVTLQHIGTRLVQVVPAAAEPLAGTPQD